MTDRYERIRKALKMGPTPGPWSARYDYVVQAKSFDEGRLVPIAQPYGLRVDGSDLFANSAHIAACGPDTIRAMLDERDALAAENERLKEKVGVTMGVGSGGGKSFVHGDYDSIKVLQGKLLEMERLRSDNERLKSEAGYTAADVATAAADGFRDGVRSVDLEKFREVISDLSHSCLVDGYEPDQAAFLEYIRERLLALIDEHKGE